MSVVTLLNAVSANTTGPVAGLGTPYGNLTVSVSTTGTVSAFSVVVQGSIDGFNFEAIGSAITATTAGTSVGSGVLFQYFQAVLSGYSGTGTVTVELAYSLNSSASGGGGPPTGAAGGVLTGTYPNPGLATVTIGEGGTGQTAQQAAINALTGTQSAGTYLRSNGTNASLSAIQGADLPSGTTSAKGALQLDGTAADIQAAGTQAAGSNGLAADSGHVHPLTPVWVPADFGYISWSHDPAITVTNGLVINGQTAFAAVPIRNARTITNLIVDIFAAGGSLTTGNFLGLFSSSGTQVGLTADQTATSAFTTPGICTVALTSTYSAAAGIYYVALMTNSSTTSTLKLTGLNINANEPNRVSPKRYGAYTTTGTALPGSVTVSSLATPTNVYNWAAVS